MNGINLTFESMTVSTGARPETFQELVRLAEVHFPHLQIESAAYRDEEGDEVIIRSDKDLHEALRLSTTIWHLPELEIRLFGLPLTSSFMTTSQAQCIQPTSCPVEEMKSQEVSEGGEGRCIDEPEISHTFSSLHLTDPPEDRYLTCFKCNGDGKTRKGKPCRLCEAKGVVNVATHPKFRRITEIVREEIRATLARIQVPAEKLQIPEGGEIHEGVTCDGCGVAPIIGPRFKCSVCDNFDFCPQCERTVQHMHAFLKIRSPDVRPARIVTILSDSSDPCKKRKTSSSDCLSCQNVSNPSEDVTYPSGATLTTKWTVKNNGNDIWPSGCWMQCVKGPCGERVRMPQVAPGETYDVDVTITLPTEPGQSNSLWQVFSPSGQPFGDSFSIVFTIESPADRTRRQAQLLLSYMQRDAVLASSVLESCGGNIELANEKLSQLLG